MTQAWMIRAGRSGKCLEHFESGFVTVGWGAMGDLGNLKTKEMILHAYEIAYPGTKPGKRNLAVGMIDKFVNQVSIGDLVVTYNSQSREYLIGRITGEYEHHADQEDALAHSREVKWHGKAARDKLTSASKNSLGAIMTLFSLSDDVINDLERVSRGESTPEALEENESTTPEDPLEAAESRSKELIKDKLVALDPDEMEELLAALLRAMGFRTRVSPTGPDRGVDVFASPDGLGLEEPRIKAEVKHRNGTIGSQPIRSFIGALRAGDRGIFLSTGGFSKEAKYEADRSNIPVTLMDIDLLADLVIANYDQFDLEGRALIQLVRIYWPADH
ncbi:restriction endonuclease [Parahaliea mediterranea]|uniref:Restriction endonuclease n=1 Tax=Parahaliea mediterranea TaxID=651086 RepID=A0A939DGM4_9GAMM|nr:restriction endonuclease [Parahaliea mediterranea]MBN7797811.1 restriction endonuclease [Parahaliea mediterranea]